MKYSGIGGQAVLEGVMMKNKEKYAVAVRKPDGEITVDTKEYYGLIKNKTLRNIPILRGVLSFVESLTLGISTLTYSASFFEEDEEDTKAKKKELSKEAVAKKEKAEMGITVAFSFVLAIGIFMILPYYLSLIFQKFITSHVALALIEGIIRMMIFLAYIASISLMKDIQRVFMYHGAEHKCINCIEHGLELNVANVRASSKEHKRCGTSFIMIVMVISILFFMVIRVDTIWLRIVSRIVLIPVIAGVSYEVLRLAGTSNSKIMDIVSRPGMWMQGLTTKEPDDSMIEVAIAAVEAVFDWKKYLEENFPEQYPDGYFEKEGRSGENAQEITA